MKSVFYSEEQFTKGFGGGKELGIWKMDGGVNFRKKKPTQTIFTDILLSLQLLS